MTTLVEIQPTGPQALGVIAALGEAAARLHLHVTAVRISQPLDGLRGALGVSLLVFADITGLDRTTPATAPTAQRLLREMGAAWDDVQPERVDDGRRYWAAALVGQGIHLTLTTPVVTRVPARAGA